MVTGVAGLGKTTLLDPLCRIAKNDETGKLLKIRGL
jgi:ABC-type cobalamin/Fe3+-siderophores transport system ATPase subunit